MIRLVPSFMPECRHPLELNSYPRHRLVCHHRFVRSSTPGLTRPQRLPGTSMSLRMAPLSPRLLRSRVTTTLKQELPRQRNWLCQNCKWCSILLSCCVRRLTPINVTARPRRTLSCYLQATATRQEVAFAQCDAVVSQNVIGRGDMEIEIGEYPVVQILHAFEFKLTGPCLNFDVFLF